MSNLITDHAGIIITFYGPRQKMQNVTNLLGSALGLVIQAFPDQPDLSRPEEEKFLRYFDPPAAYDTRVVQLALNESGEASVAWERLRQRVEQLDLTGVWQVIWGYSLIYHAALMSGEPDSPFAGLKAARPPASPERKRPRPLARSEILASHLWLLDIPSKEDEEGIKAANVYVALYPPAQEDQFITQILYGPNAALLMLDLVAHKGYRQKRQYIGKPRELYRQQIQSSHELITSLLNFSPETTNLIKPSNIKQNLAHLSASYTRLLDTTRLLDDLRLSLAQQLENYEWWEEELGKSKLTIFHHKQMQTAHRDLDLLIAKGQAALEAVRTAIEMIQTYLEQIREENERRFQTILAAAGVALAVTALIDAEVAKALIKPLMPLLAHKRLVQLLVQLVITAILTALIAWIYHRVSKKKHE